MKGYRKLPFTTTWLVLLVYVFLAVGFLYLDSLKMLQLLLGMVILYALSLHYKQPSTIATYVVLGLFVFVIEWEIDAYLTALPPWLAIALSWLIVPWLIDIGFRLNYALLRYTSSFACSAGLCLPYISQRYDCNGNAEGYRKQPPWTSPRLCHYFLSPEGSMSHGRGIGLLDLS